MEINKLPTPKKNTSGVYQFIDNKKNIIYIGSSKNIYERIKYYKKTKNNLKHSLIKKEVADIKYIYTEDYKEQEKLLIQQLQPKHNKKSLKQEIYLPRDTKYIDNYLMKKAMKKADIGLIPTKKGTGKTTQWIREALIGYLKNGKPSFYVRSTIEQLEEFVQDDKFAEVLKVIGFPITKNISITRKGMFNLTYDKKAGKKAKEPIIYFLSINEAMKIQSSKFKPGNYMILDEIQNHFAKNSHLVFNKFLNLMASVLREENTDIIILFNKINNNDLFLQKFKVDRQVQNIKMGAVKRFRRSFGRDTAGNLVEITIAIYNPLQSKKLIESQSASIAYKLGHLSDYGKAIRTDDFVIDTADIKYIKKYGNFQGIINFNGFKIGYWKRQLGDGRSIPQFSEKYNSNGKVYFLLIGDYSNKANLIRQDFLIKTKNNLLLKQVEFSDAGTFNTVQNMLEQINLYKNEIKGK